VMRENNKKIGIVIASNDPETCWVAVRYAAFHLLEQKSVSIYFVDSGVNCKDMHSEKYDIKKLLEYFRRSGGQVYMCDNREILKSLLMNHFCSLLAKKEIVRMSDDDKIQSIMTENVYIREFKRII